MQEVPPIQEVPPYTGSPALYRKSRPYTGSPAHIPEVPPLYRKLRPPVINHFDRWCMVLTTHNDSFIILLLSLVSLEQKNYND